jgi:hypothetical protein
LQPVTQQKITKAIYRVCNDLARPLGRDSLTYAEGIELLRQSYGTGKIPWCIPLGIAYMLFPPHVVTNLPSDVKAIAENFDLSSLDSEAKLEALVLSVPEPSPEGLETALKIINDVLPQLRHLLFTKAKALPHSRGGAPKLLASSAEQEGVREAIKALRGPGIKLDDVFRRVAQRHGVSASKIKQIWYSAKGSPSD